MKGKVGAGRDFVVTDLDGEQQYFVDGKMGPRPKAEVQDASGGVRYSVRGKMLGIPKKMEVTDAGGHDVASLSGVDPGLALAVVWAIDRWVERD